MPKVYDLMTDILKFFLNVLFVLQIVLMILVFLTATYWFFNLINVSAFDFAAPIALTISDIVKIYYHEEVQIGGLYIDGSLLLFDLIAIVCVYGLTKLKYHVHRAMDSVAIAKRECMDELEVKFNKQLQSEAQAAIMKCNTVAVLVQFTAKNMFVDACWGGNQDEGVKEREEEAFKIFYASIKNITGCKFAKTGDKMLIILNNFDKIDNLLHFIDMSIDRIRTNMRKEHWSLFSFIAVDVYNNKTNFKTEVYPTLERLLALRQKNEAVCLGNFTMRYNLQQEKMYTPFMRGTYNLNGECDVWALVKKD